MIRTLLAVLSLAAAVSADVITVPGDFNTIQGAINAADDGDEIIVGPGTYNEALNLLGKEIHLHSADGPGVTTLDGAGLGDVIIRAQSGETFDTIIEGFSIINGQGTANAGSCVGAPTHAGAVHIRFLAALTFIDCHFENNGHNLGLGSGGAIAAWNAGLQVLGCTFIDNGGYDVDEDLNTAFGGAVYLCSFNEPVDLVIEDCVFDSNGPSSHGGAVWVDTAGTVSIIDSDFVDNAASFGGGVNVYCSTNKFNHPASARIEGCSFIDNDAGFGAGIFGQTSEAGYFGPEGVIEVVDCDFLGNHAGPECCNTGIYWSLCWQDGVNYGTYFGGGLDLRASTGTIRVANSLFADNDAWDASGLHLSTCGEVDFDLFGGTIELSNITVADNTGEGVRLRLGFTGDFDITNAIVDGNTDADLLTELHEPVDGKSSIDVTYSNIAGGFDGDGNIDADPNFVDRGAGDYRIGAGSPAIDAGSNDGVLVGTTTDLAGDPRFVDDPDTTDTGLGDAPIVDMGAYEFQAGCAADVNGDGELNVLDFVAYQLLWQAQDPAADCDANAQFNILDFVCFQLLFEEGC